MLNVHTHESVRRGETAEFQVVLDDVLSPSKRETGFFASDMDDTMFHGDSGQLIFVECLRQPAFFAEANPDELCQILLPESDIGAGYTARGFIEKGAAGQLDGISSADCIAALAWRERIADDFRRIQARIQTGARDTEEDIRRFIVHTLEFDNLLISLIRQHPDQVVSGRIATAFSRVRLFKGQSAKHLAHLAVTLLSTRHDATERHYTLDIAAKRIIDRSIRINASILQVLGDVTEQGMSGFVITGSPQPIADSLITHSPYRPLTPLERVKGVNLQQSDEGVLTGYIEGQHVFGITKRHILETIQQNTGSRVLMALGDYPSSDRHMGAMALENGGVFIVTHSPGNVEETRDRFDRALREIMGNTEIERASGRIIYLAGEEKSLSDF